MAEEKDVEAGKDATQVASLNKQNVRMLRALAIAHVGACLVWVVGVHWDDGDFFSTTGALVPLYKSVSFGFLTLASLATIAMARLIPRVWERRLVHLRWKFPLPACHAFSEYAKADLRVEVQDLRRAYGELPTDEKEQNKLWYKFYLKHQRHNPHIAYHHRVYLLLSDSAMLVLLLLPLVAVIFGITGTLDTGRVLLALMGVEFLVFRQAAHNAGAELVTDVLALESDAVAPVAKKKAAKAPA
jgi:hypothetical protein